MADEQVSSPAGKCGKIVGATGCCVVLGLLGCLVSAFVASKLDTGFQKELAEKHARERASIGAMRVKLAAFAAKLPAPGSLQGESKVPAALRSKVGEVILTDAAFLASYRADGTVAAPASEFVHDPDLRSLTDSLVRSLEVDGWSDYDVDACGDMVTRMNAKGVVALFMPTQFVLPVAGTTGFQAGVADGQLALLSLEDGTVIAHGPLHAQSSEKVEVGGGVGIRIGPVHVGTVGGTDTDDALASDFVARCNAAVEETVARLKAP